MTIPFCPLHGTEQRLCSSWCFEARALFAVASADLEIYWVMRYGREKAAAPRHTEAGKTPTHAEYVATVLGWRSVA